MTAYRPHPLDSGNPPAWASGWGEDRFGVFVAFAVGEVEQRMRWIPPGTFWMGSPQTEIGRDDDEILHLVTLNKGFWLADTPCTQALWEAVTEENPSKFKTPDRPVEQVSWEDAQAFLSRLSSVVPGLEPRLPTEAEWEYACRAGAETATYAGDLGGEAESPTLDPIAWYRGNSDQAFDLAGHERGTHAVARKLPNPWGLHDTLGNVWEWCEDWYGPYAADSVVDPVGPDRGSLRVVRGGSWGIDARFVRAAYRNHSRPSARWYDLGFRLARGQSAL